MGAATFLLYNLLGNRRRPTGHWLTTAGRVVDETGLVHHTGIPEQVIDRRALALLGVVALPAGGCTHLRLRFAWALGPARKLPQSYAGRVLSFAVRKFGGC